jgi:hypothetical protein
MIKAAVIGLAAAGAVIAAEAGTDKVLALREAHSTAAASRTTEARKTHEMRSMSRASRTGRSRATP